MVNGFNLGKLLDLRFHTKIWRRILSGVGYKLRCEPGLEFQTREINPLVGRLVVSWLFGCFFGQSVRVCREQSNQLSRLTHFFSQDSSRVRQYACGPASDTVDLKSVAITCKHAKFEFERGDDTTGFDWRPSDMSSSHDKKNNHDKRMRPISLMHTKHPVARTPLCVNATLSRLCRHTLLILRPCSADTMLGGIGTVPADI